MKTLIKPFFQSSFKSGKITYYKLWVGGEVVNLPVPLPPINVCSFC